MLRDYQKRSIDMLYKWFMDGNQGHPCLVLPTGSGKSHIVAALCKDALQQWPDTKVLMLTAQKELIEQNAEKMRQHWPGAPMGIYSASIGKRQLGEPITFAGIQSVRTKAHLIGHVDLVLIDECHMVSHKDEGGYRQLINDLMLINPNLRVVGLTATPYRLGHGLITDKPALFDDLIEPVSIEELIAKGFLSVLKSKVTRTKLSTDGVHKRGGEFIESELQKAVDTDPMNIAIVDEVMAVAGNRKSWLFFCSGVKHANHIAEALRERGISAESVDGSTTKSDRERILSDFKSGKLQAVTNCAVLTTGFDAPNIDLIAMLRPTMSPGLYVQMAGRGLRLKDHTDHCLVLDFAGAVATHGPITSVQPPKKAGSGDGTAPVKACPECAELVHLSAKTCPACHYIFPIPEAKILELRTDDIMGIEGTDMSISAWKWAVHTSRTTGKEMVKVSYYGSALSDPVVTEYLTVLHEGGAGQKALRTLASISNDAGITLPDEGTLLDLCKHMNNGKHPLEIEFKRDGKFYRVINRKWSNENN